MEWFLLKQYNITYSICININTKNTIEVFVRNGDHLYHGRSVRNDHNNGLMVVLLDVFMQRYKGLNIEWKMAVVDMLLSFHNSVGFLTVGDLEKPDSCCCIGLLPVKNNYIEALYRANKYLVAITSLVDLKNGK